MTSIPQSEGLPVAELAEDAEQYLEPLLRQLPEKRLRAVGVLMVLGILAGQTPLITQMARGMAVATFLTWRAGCIVLSGTDG